MKIMVVGDVHWSQYSSILRKRGDVYSYRLENLIKSVNWVEESAKQNNCDVIIYLGDFFDKSDLNSEEISALYYINWSHIPHYFIVGNHEAGRQDLEFNSASVFRLTNAVVLQYPVNLGDVGEPATKLVFLPYIVESNRKPLCEYINNEYSGDRCIIFSHNDIKGIQMGNFISKEGFSIEEIEENCDLFLNGHLHNGNKITDKVINVGNLTGQNFSEDAFIYNHSVIVLDTETLQTTTYENPFALNFYKLDLTILLNNVEDIHIILGKLKNNSIITVKCDDNDVEYLRNIFDNNDKIIEYRFIVQSHNQSINNNIETFSINHLEEFKNYMLKYFENNDILLSELQEVCV